MNRSFLSPGRRRIAAACLVLAPLLFTTAEFLTPQSDGTPGELLDALAAAGPTATMGLAATLLSSLLFVPGLFGLLSRPMRRGTAIADAGLALLYYGLVANVALVGLNVMFVAMADPAMDRVAMVALFERMTHETTIVIPLLAGHYLMAAGALLLGLGLWRGGVGPRWAAVAVGLAGVTDALLGSVGLEEVGSVVSNALLVCGFVAYAWLLLHERAEAPIENAAAMPAATMAG
ncbi:hypothetical protein GA0111570_10967 [Raineyella antarctica]|uniref:DUF4386 family protein n=1 Tax=Raineyella antarctica TaxID=1577474 RepID=A0A1G6HER5_9ACTN|nr:hypothetical protein [Raineyella antarctica]SDB92752.1 hypothetical protein GA0111570_10967 [Raineyella antarctica]